VPGHNIKPPSYGRRGGRPPFSAFRAGSRRHSRTGRESFTSSGSSVRGSLSQIPFAVYAVVAVAVEQHQVGEAVVVLPPLTLRCAQGRLLTCRTIGVSSLRARLLVPSLKASRVSWRCQSCSATLRKVASLR